MGLVSPILDFHASGKSGTYLKEWISRIHGFFAAVVFKLILFLAFSQRGYVPMWKNRISARSLPSFRMGGGGVGAGKEGDYGPPHFSGELNIH